MDTYKSKLISSYTLNMRSLLYANHTSIKPLKTKITATNLLTALLLSHASADWDTILGWNIFLWWMYTLGYQSPFLIFGFSDSKPYPHSTGHIHLGWILRMILVQHLLSFDSPSSLGSEFFIPFKSISAITCYYCLISPTSKTQTKYNYNANLIVYC